MYKQFNFEVVIVSVATLILLLSATIGQARDTDYGLYNTIYEQEALQHTPPKLSKVSRSRYHGNRSHRYRSNRNYYRGNRYFRGGNSYYNGRRYYRGNKRYYNPRYRYYDYGNRYNYRHRYGH